MKLIFELTNFYPYDGKKLKSHNKICFFFIFYQKTEQYLLYSKDSRSKQFLLLKKRKKSIKFVKI